MLSDEEIEALEILNNTEWDGFMITIKNLIEKQSKEIEDNKKYIDLHYVPYEQYVSITNGIDKKWKDKIKAKIEELEKRWKE